MYASAAMLTASWIPSDCVRLRNKNAAIANRIARHKTTAGRLIDRIALTFLNQRFAFSQRFLTDDRRLCILDLGPMAFRPTLAKPAHENATAFKWIPLIPRCIADENLFARVN